MINNYSNYGYYETLSDKELMAMQAWNRENNDLFSSWFNPGSQQQEEFAQQVTLQNMQNQWNSEAERMQRMKDAGINANVAAAGIAGAGSASSVSSPNSAVGAGASGVGALAQGAEALNNSVNAGVGAYEKLSLTGVEKDRRKAEIRNLLSSALHNDWLAYSISEMLPLQKESERVETYLKLANFEKAREEKKLIIKRVDEAQSHIDEMNAQASLYHKQGNLVDAEKLRVDAQTAQVQLQNDKLQWEKDWRERYRYDPSAPVDVALEQAMVNDAPDDVVSAIGESVKNVSYNNRKGVNDAEIEDAYIKAYNELKAKADIDADFAPYMAMIEANKQSLIEFIKMMTENPDDIKGILSKLMNLIGNIGLSMRIDKGPVNNAVKPNGGVTVTR